MIASADSCLERSCTQMLLGQNAPKKHTKERTSENAREYDQTDCDVIHDQHSLRRQAVLKNSVSPSRTRHGAFGKTLRIPLGENSPQSGSRDLRWTRLSCYIRPGGRKTSAIDISGCYRPRGVGSATTAS